MRSCFGGGAEVELAGAEVHQVRQLRGDAPASRDAGPAAGALANAVTGPPGISAASGAASPQFSTGIGIHRRRRLCRRAAP
jgi:hypothetical protein